MMTLPQMWELVQDIAEIDAREREARATAEAFARLPRHVG